MDIKRFKEFARMNNVDISPIMRDAILNLNNHANEDEFVKTELDNNTLNITLSGVADTPVSELTTNIIMLIMPPNFTPNVLADIKPSSLNVKDTTLDEYVVISDENAREMARKIFNDGKEMYPNINNIKANILY